MGDIQQGLSLNQIWLPFSIYRAESVLHDYQEDERPIWIIMFNIIAYWPCDVGEKTHFMLESIYENGLFTAVFFILLCTQDYATRSYDLYYKPGNNII